MWMKHAITMHYQDLVSVYNERAHVNYNLFLFLYFYLIFNEVINYYLVFFLQYQLIVFILLYWVDELYYENFSLWNIDQMNYCVDDVFYLKFIRIFFLFRFLFLFLFLFNRYFLWLQFSLPISELILIYHSDSLFRSCFISSLYELNFLHFHICAVYLIHVNECYFVDGYDFSNHGI